MTSDTQLDVILRDFEVPAQARPRHIAVIMDGNGRWAQRQGLDRSDGHRAGTTSARTIIECCARLGIEALTLYSFSTENWTRPVEEVRALMGLVVEMLPQEHATLVRNSIRFRTIGERDGLPAQVLAELDRATALTEHNEGLQLTIALNYGSRQEIVHAMRTLGDRVRSGDLDPADIDESMVSDALWTTGLPDPDLLLRTAGEMRVSNYLLWQISYAEIVVVDDCWPDFGAAQFLDALRTYAQRTRRFGAALPEEQ